MPKNQWRKAVVPRRSRGKGLTRRAAEPSSCTGLTLSWGLQPAAVRPAAESWDRGNKCKYEEAGIALSTPPPE